MDDDETPIDWHAPELEKARDEIERAVGSYARTLAAQEGRDEPIVLAWVVGYEATSIQLDRDDTGIRQSIVPNSQILSTSLGLGAWLADRW